MQTFFLKTPASFFSAVWDSLKPFELLEDKGYQVGDRIVRLEFHESACQFTGRLADALISYKIDSSELGLEKGFCVIGLSNVELADVHKFKGSFLPHIPSREYITKKLYEEGLDQLNKELEEAYAECCLEVENEIDPHLEVYLNNDYYNRQDVA
jgi:hypothetical protein